MKRIVLQDYRFKLGVKRYEGIIHAEQGLPMFYCEGEGVVARLTFPVSVWQYEEPYTAYIRNGEDAAINQLEKDDILLEDIRDDMLDVTENMGYLSDFQNEARVQHLPKALSWIGGTIATSIALLVALLFKLWIVAGVAFVITVIQIIFARKEIQVMTTNRVYDRNGKWVDTATGHTSLNGGYRIEMKGY